MKQQERANFGSKLGIILATAGGAVGLGNIWRFPYMAGANGGAAFILIYIGCVLLLGLPCMIGEFIIGRHAASNTARPIQNCLTERHGNGWAIWVLSPDFSSQVTMQWCRGGAYSMFLQPLQVSCTGRPQTLPTISRTLAATLGSQYYGRLQYC